VQRQRATAVDIANTTGGGASSETGLLRGLIAQVSLILVVGGVYVQTLLPGSGHSHDTAEAQFSVPLLCLTHPTGYPSYLLLGHAFSRLVPLGTPAYRTNLLSAVFGVLACVVVRRLLRRLGARELVAWAFAAAANKISPAMITLESLAIDIIVALVMNRFMRRPSDSGRFSPLSASSR